MSDKNWRDSQVGPTSSIRHVLEVIERTGLQVALVVDDSDRLLGLVTDGDVRRFILDGGALDASVIKVMNTSPLTVRPDEDRRMILAQMRAHSVHQMPIVDSQRRIVGLSTLDELVTVEARDNLVILMAGGFGVRLRPLTDHTPKPMLKVGRRPLLETIMLQFIEHGFGRFKISVNYKADTIMDYFGDGERLGADVSYLCETEPLGTAGALALLDERPTTPFFLMNADLLTKLNFENLLAFHESHQSPMTMCVREYTHSVPYGVANIEGDRLVTLMEKPTYMSLVNAGIYVCDPDVLDFVPQAKKTDVTDLVQALIVQGRNPVIFPIQEYWLDIGHHHDLSRAAEDFPTLFD